MRFLVTGGAGFIGSNIVRRLLADGHAVRVLDNFSSGKPENLSDVVDDIELWEGDIRDYWTVERAVHDVDVILHQAAIPSVPKSMANPLTSHLVNVDGTVNLLETARLAGVKRFVFASSCAVYGDTDRLPIDEDTPAQPKSPYAVGKLVGEHYVLGYHRAYGLPGVVLRYFNIFGPRQDPQGDYAPVIPRFIARLQAGEPPIVYGDGEQTRDFLYVENAVAANLLAAERDDMVGGVFNVGSGQERSLNELLVQLRAVMERDISARHEPPRAGDIRRSRAAVDRLMSHGFTPPVDFETGLARTVAFFTGQG